MFAETLLSTSCILGHGRYLNLKASFPMPGLESGGLIHLRRFTTARLSTANLRRRALEQLQDVLM